MVVGWWSQSGTAARGLELGGAAAKSPEAQHGLGQEQRLRTLLLVTPCSGSEFQEGALLSF